MAQKGTDIMSVSASPAVIKVLDKLDRVKKRGNGWRALCPVHGDRNPSLDIDEGNNGCVLLCCRSHGCKPADIVDALELTMGDLFVKDERQSRDYGARDTQGPTPTQSEGNGRRPERDHDMTTLSPPPAMRKGQFLSDDEAYSESPSALIPDIEAVVEDGAAYVCSKCHNVEAGCYENETALFCTQIAEGAAYTLGKDRKVYVHPQAEAIATDDPPTEAGPALPAGAEEKLALDTAIRTGDAGEAAKAVLDYSDKAEKPALDAEGEQDYRAVPPHLLALVERARANGEFPPSVLEDVTLPNGDRRRRFAYYADDTMTVNERGGLDYTHGDFLGVKVRIDYAKPRPDGRKKQTWWEWVPGKGKIDQHRLLYLADGWEDAEGQAIIVEGEKTADELAARFKKMDWPIRVIAIPSASSRPTDEALRKALFMCDEVGLWPDNDTAGEDLMEYIAGVLAAIDKRQVDWIEWPDAPPKGDAADYVKTHSAEELTALLERAETVGGRPETWGAPDRRKLRAPLKKDERAKPSFAEQLREKLRAKQAARLGMIVALKDYVVPQMVSVIVDWLPADSLALLHGASNTYKSLTAVGMLCSIDTGKAWYGNAVWRGEGLYLLAEGQRGLNRRIRGWEIVNKLGTERLYVLPRGIALDDPNVRATVVDGIKAMSVMPKLIVVDALARYFDGEENDPTAMGRFVKALDELRILTGACVLVVHHDTKDGRTERGSTALRAAMDVVIGVTRRGKTITLKNSKMKDGAEGETIRLTLRPVDLGERDGLGREITSAVLDLATTRAQPDDATDDDDDDDDDGPELDGVARDVLTFLPEDGAISADWQRACEDAQVCKRAAFYKALAELVDAGLVTDTGGKQGEKYRLTPAGRALLDMS